MVKSRVEFVVISPEEPDEDGTVYAIAPSIFEEFCTDENNLIKLPRNVEGINLYRGVVLTGYGQLFKKLGEEVMPHELHVERIPNSEIKDTKEQRAVSWD